MKGNCINCGKSFYTKAGDLCCQAHKKYFCCSCYTDLGGDTFMMMPPKHIPESQIWVYVTEKIYKKHF